MSYLQSLSFVLPPDVEVVVDLGLGLLLGQLGGRLQDVLREQLPEPGGYDVELDPEADDFV